ncbi:17332_t:CDS:1, partial [Cetraspora pellucida]
MLECQRCGKELKDKRALRWSYCCSSCEKEQSVLDTGLCYDCYINNEEYYDSIERSKLFIDDDSKLCSKCEKLQLEKKRVEEIIKKNNIVQFLIKELTKTNERVSILEENIVQLQLQLQEQKSEEIETTRNILLFGRTGSGKSTLANVLTGINKFKEGNYAVSETRNIQQEEFEYEGIKYKVIDTVGIGDTKLSEKEVLDKMAEATYLLRNGLTQVLFVTSGRFCEEEITTYNLLKLVIFDENISEYTTIVRSRFSNFKDEKECKNDIKLMNANSNALKELIKSCNKVIHVNNLTKEEDDTLEARNESRNILLSHLATCQEVYKTQRLRQLVAKIYLPMREKERIQRELNLLINSTEADSKEVEQLVQKANQLEETIRDGTLQHIREKQQKTSWTKKVGTVIGTVVGTAAEKAAEKAADEFANSV